MLILWIPHAERCNSQPDCIDASDEKDCDKKDQDQAAMHSGLRGQKTHVEIMALNDGFWCYLKIFIKEI